MRGFALAMMKREGGHGVCAISQPRRANALRFKNAHADLTQSCVQRRRRARANVAASLTNAHAAGFSPAIRSAIALVIYPQHSSIVPAFCGRRLLLTYTHSALCLGKGDERRTFLSVVNTR